MAMTLEGARMQAIQTLEEARITITEEEKKRMEITDLGLGNIEEIGAQILVYINSEIYCAKELVIFPRQTFPEHRHPPVGEIPGIMETFRCRKGMFYLYVPGKPTLNIKAQVPRGKEKVFTARHEIILKPGDQFTIKPNLFHWFQAGDEGCVVSEFSSRSRDQFDIFTDKSIRRDFQDDLNKS